MIVNDDLMCFAPNINMNIKQKQQKKGLLSCRKKHQRRYCCLMACNILNGASRACKKINALLHRKECIYSIQLTSCDDDGHKYFYEDEEKKEELTKKINDNDKPKAAHKKVYRLALGTNLGRLIIVTLKQDLSWTNTRRSFIDEYTIAFQEEPLSVSQQNNNNNNNNTSDISNGFSHNKSPLYGSTITHSTQNNTNINMNVNMNMNITNGYSMTDAIKKNKHHRKASSKSLKYSVLTARERCFREMAELTGMITYDSMKKYLWNESSQIEEQDIKEFFQFMEPNKKNQITFTQFVQKIDDDGNFMRAFEEFCLTGSSRTNRRAWMDDDDDDTKSDGYDDTTTEITGDGNTKTGENGNITMGDSEDDSDWELAMLNNGGGDKLTDEHAITALAWNSNDKWIISGHQEGTIKFWSKEYYPSDYDYIDIAQNKYIKQSKFYYVCRGSMKRHSETISCLSLSGTYLVSSSSDGNILIWHLDFLLPSVNLPMNITSYSRGIIQLLATINSAHLGDEICDVKLSQISNNLSVCIPNALFLLSCGADENIRCRDVMEILRQQLTLRILAESQPKQAITSQTMREKRASIHPGMDLNDINNNAPIYPRYDSYTANRIISPNRSGAIMGLDNDDSYDSDGSDFGATTYN